MLSASAVDLASEPDFELGGVVVSPSTGRVRSAERELRVEPKIMQVLVVLARQGGQTVSRADLIERCWGGRIVSDDAVTRALAQVRALAREFQPPPYALETLSKLGFRLIPAANGTASGPAEPPALRLAVLPFDNLTDDPNAAHLPDGIADQILHTLAQRGGLSVIGRSSSFQFRGADKAAANVARRLGATHILDGAVRIAGARIRVSVQIVSCATQATIWSHQLERELGDVFALQDDVASAAAAALSHAVSSDRPASPIDPLAYDLYLRARVATDRWKGGGDADLLAQAVAAAPGFATAWGSLALTRAVQARDKTATTEAVMALQAQAGRAADTALSLDPDLPVAHVARAVLRPACGAFEEADADLDRALSGAGRDPWVLFHAAEAAQARGRLNEALHYAQRARQIEPYWPQGLVQLASILEDTGRQDQADKVFDAARAQWPDIDYVVISSIYRAAYANRWARVDGLAEDIRRVGPHGKATTRALQRLEQRRRADPDDGLAVLEQERRRIAETGTMGLGIAMLCRDGHADAAFELVELASFDHLFEPAGRTVPGDLGLQGLFFSFGRAMRSDPRFVRLCAKLGLARYWVHSGKWPDCVEETAGSYDFRAECRRLAN